MKKVANLKTDYTEWAW